jgi:hypothetical protein
MMFKSEGLIDKPNGELSRGANAFDGSRLARFRQQKFPSQILLPLIEWPIALGVWLVGTYQLFFAMRALPIGTDPEPVYISLLCLACIGGVIPMAIYSLLAERHRKTPRMLLIDVVAAGAIVLWLVIPVSQSYTTEPPRIAKTEPQVKHEQGPAKITLTAPTPAPSPEAGL